MSRLLLAPQLRWYILITLIFSVTGCVIKNAPLQTNVLASTTPSMSPVAILASTIEASPTPTFTPTLTSTKPVWGIMEGWTLANQIRAVLIDQSGDLWTGGPAGVVHWNLKTNMPTVYAIKDNPKNTNVTALSQTPDGAIWAGTSGNGLARFDGTSWQSFTTENGLPGNYIISQAISSQGELWLTTETDNASMQSSSYFGQFDGMKWIMEPGGAFTRIVASPNGSIVGAFNYGFTGTSFVSKVSIFDGQTWNYSDVVPDGWVDAITVSPDGAIWFATDNTVYRYIHQKWENIMPPWAQKDFPQISSLAVSANGVAWFGFSLIDVLDPCGSRALIEEKGVYRYDGKTWTYFTAQDGLIDNKICAITADVNNNVWFGSFDKGVSRFDGQTWTSYVIP
ncbi:MAG: two-component regulator propeller domain-containing protein [Chloroflexota bacterium]